ncbi:Wadjet anti-phage system protein JetD domain-containing protein [Alkalimonas sp.]|uniref:DUF7281 domain-containing protein n=1 Tax=Alkalimonas sp. TaxID=1872453 RepID=UPI00263B44A9|nr:Wadjet anti-phage system protein JetD domain-containing protein [Alkalimonas sp.]MCC5825625.1 hypothetical protein [Alkalimonas sp.]
MLPVLSPAACRFLRQLSPKVLAAGRLKKSTRQKSVQEVLCWCLAHQLEQVPGNCLQRPDFYFEPALLQQIAAVQQALGHPDYRLDFSNQSRPDAALQSQIEQKSIGIKPRQARILLRLPQPQRLAGIAVQELDLDWQQLSLPDYEALLVVENLDCFYQLERFAIELPYQHILIVYRGDRHYSSGCKALKAAWLSLQKPTIYFGDFDGKGVSIALHEGYQAMLLPAFAELQQQVSAAMLPDKQLKFLPATEQHPTSPAFQPYQQLLCQQLKGLRQQQMQGMALAPVLLS